ESAIGRHKRGATVENGASTGRASRSAARAVGFTCAGFAVAAIGAAAAVAVECAEQKGEISAVVVDAAAKPGTGRPVGPVGTEAGAIATVAAPTVAAGGAEPSGSRADAAGCAWMMGG